MKYIKENPDYASGDEYGSGDASYTSGNKYGDGYGIGYGIGSGFGDKHGTG